MTGIMDLLQLARPQGSVSDIPKHGPALPLPLTPRTEYLGDVGPPTAQQRGALNSMGEPETDVTDQFNQALAAPPPAAPPRPTQAYQDGALPAPLAPSGIPVSGPAATPSPVPQSRAPDGREGLRDLGKALVAKGTIGQRIQGLQLIFEANKMLPEESAALERERNLTLLDEALAGAPVDAEDRAMAIASVKAGEDPKKVLQDLRNLDAKKDRLSNRQRLSAWSSANTADAQTLGMAEASAERAFELIDKGTLTTGLGGWFNQFVPGSDANALLTFLKPLQAMVGFDRLQQIRDASKTGGGLGAVSNVENTFLQAAQGSLDPVNTPPDDLKANIATIVAGKRLLQQLHALVPRMDAGDPEAHAEAAQIAAQVGRLGTQIRKQIAQDNAAQSVAQDRPPAPGARKAPDGNWYVEGD